MQQLYALILLFALSTNLLVSYDIVAPGVFYEHVVTHNPAQSIHLLIVDPCKATIKLGIADDKCACAKTTTEIATQHHAIAAINGGFFDFGCKNKVEDFLIRCLDFLGYTAYKAYPVYTLKNNSRYYAVSSLYTGAVGWNEGDQPIFGSIKTHIDVTINGQLYTGNELNKPHPKIPTLYSDCYDAITPAYHKRVDEIIIEDNRITKIQRRSRGKTVLPHHGWVYALPKGYKKLTASLQEGDSVTITVAYDRQADLAPVIAHEDWSTKQHILAGTPLLIYNNQIIADLGTRTSAFYTKRHPRSAIGLLKDSAWVLVVIDGKQKHSAGFTISELAQYMLGLGCSAALNLDGGGSSTMVVNNSVVNIPSGRVYSLFGKEQAVSNALLICTK